jgi:hypothetical protein
MTEVQLAVDDRVELSYNRLHASRLIVVVNWRTVWVSFGLSL